MLRRAAPLPARADRRGAGGLAAGAHPRPERGGDAGAAGAPAPGHHGARPADRSSSSPAERRLRPAPPASERPAVRVAPAPPGAAGLRGARRPGRALARRAKLRAPRGRCRACGRCPDVRGPARRAGSRPHARRSRSAAGGGLAECGHARTALVGPYLNACPGRTSSRAPSRGGARLDYRGLLNEEQVAVVEAGEGPHPRGGRRRLRQDPHPHLAGGAPPPRRRRARVDPAPHLHQQGGQGDAPPGRGGGPGRHPPPHRRHLPPRGPPAPAGARRRARLRPRLLDPRPGGLERRHDRRHRRLRPGGGGPALPQGRRARRPRLHGGQHPDAAGGPGGDAPAAVRAAHRADPARWRGASPSGSATSTPWTSTTSCSTGRSCWPSGSRCGGPWPERFRHILVDEYQDTNRLQGDVVDLLALDHQNLCVVGDDAQSIYGFRGAHFANILEFEQRYPTARRFALTVNYRSTPQVLALANASIACNVRQFKKELPQRPGRTGRCRRWSPAATSSSRRPSWPSGSSSCATRGCRSRRSAVLYRAHHHSMEIQFELARRGIPFVVRSGVRFFEASHVKDVLAHLRFARNPGDELALKRCLKVTPGVGTATAEAVWRALAGPAAPRGRHGGRAHRAGGGRPRAGQGAPRLRRPRRAPPVADEAADPRPPRRVDREGARRRLRGVPARPSS